MNRHPRHPRRPRTTRQRGTASLASVIVTLGLLGFGGAIADKVVFEPLKQTANTAVHTFSDRLDCYSSGQTTCP